MALLLNVILQSPGHSPVSVVAVCWGYLKTDFSLSPAHANAQPEIHWCGRSSSVPRLYRDSSHVRALFGDPFARSNFRSRAFLRFALRLITGPRDAPLSHANFPREKIPGVISPSLSLFRSRHGSIIRMELLNSALGQRDASGIAVFRDDRGTRRETREDAIIPVSPQ